MCKRLVFVICFVLALGLCLENAAAVGDLDTDKYNLSFELLADGNQADVHTDISGIAAWIPFGSGFQGIDPWCAGGCTTDTHCHCIEPTHECMFLYIRNTEGGVYQVGDDANDPNITIAAGLRYTMSFDYRPEEPPGEYARSSLFYDDGGTDAWNDPTKQMVEGYFFAPRIDVPLNNCDCGPQGGLAVYDDACWEWTTDLSITVTIPAEHPAIGYPLGWKLIAANNPDPGNRYGFFDNVRVRVDWATLAYNPSPKNQEDDVAKQPTLTWSPGFWTQDSNGHEIYFGTSFEEVNNADTTTSGVFFGAQDIDSNTWSVLNYDANGLELGKTYYWRVDEVNTTYTGPEPPVPPNNRWKGDIWYFTVTGYATNPNPEDKETDVPFVGTVLSWTPGTDSNSHDVYFGTDRDDVTNATTSVTLGVFKGNQDANYYDPGFLMAGQNYYWRIDEVNETAGTLLKGTVWSFTAVNYIVVDDFDTYATTGDLLDVWNDYWVNGTGAEVFIQKDANLVEDGSSMMFQYDNQTASYGYYSEAYADITVLDITSDWTAGGIKALTLSFMGDADNALDDMYVAVTDGSNSTGKVLYPDVNELTEGRKGYQQWNIDLEEFVAANSVDLTDIQRLTIGFGDKSSGGTGTVHFDNIRLYPPRCLQQTSFEQGNFDNDADCLVDYDDLDLFVNRDWLISGIGDTTASAPSASNLVGHWPMDDDDPQRQVDDISGNANHGLLYDDDKNPGQSTSSHHDPCSVEGTGALTFDGFDDYIELPTLNLNSNTVTLSAWVKRDGEQEMYAGVLYCFYSDPCDPNAPGTGAGIGLGSGGSIGVPYYGWEPWEINHELCYFWSADMNEFAEGWTWDWHTGLILLDQEWTLVAL
ncbi:MAG: hypothetical protein JSW23_06695, partial [Planctomycetota bacterium]